MRSIAARLFALTSVLAVAGLLGLGLLFTVTASQEEAVQARLTSALDVGESISRLRGTLSDEESAIRGYLLSGDAANVAAYDDAHGAALIQLATLDRLMAAMRAGPGEMTAVRAAVDAWENGYAEAAMAAVRNGLSDRYRTTASLREGRSRFTTLRSTLDTLQASADREQAAAAAADEIAAADRNRVFIGTGIAVVLITVLLALALRQWVARPVARLADVAERVEAGDDIAFPDDRSDELGRLGRSLERMRHTLLDARSIAEAQRELEAEAAGELRTLNDLTQLLSYLEDERSVVEAATAALEATLRPDAILVHLTNASQDRAALVFVRGDGVSPSDLRLHHLDQCPGVRRGSPYLIEDIGAPLAVPCPAHGAIEGTVACLPLQSGLERIGAIHVHWGAGIRPSESRWAVADRICGQTSLTLANRRLVTTLEASANTDPRTRLPNSRAFDVRVERLLAGRGQEPASVLMLDLDHFKDLNDRYGHPAGDEALRVFAELLRRCLRAGDVPARYGGEEFVVFLPGADAQVAHTVAERIRTMVEATPVVLAPGVITRMTVSAGIAIAPQDASDRVGLLAAADRALYAAKHAGRNRVAGTADVLDEADAPEPGHDGQAGDGTAEAGARRAGGDAAA